MDKTVLSYIWDREMGDWIEYSRETYYYTDEMAVQVPLEIFDQRVNVCPNPANQYIRLSGRILAAVSFQPLSIPVEYNISVVTS